MTASRRIQILVINGPNLNLLGLREPSTYGHETLDDVISKVREHASALSSSSSESSGAAKSPLALAGGQVDIQVDAFQHNNEGDLVSRIHATRTDGTDAIIINAGAYTHTSVALRDALIGVERPFVEVHISNVHAREPFRHHSYLSDKASGIIVGLGTFGYVAALEHCVRNLVKSKA